MRRLLWVCGLSCLSFLPVTVLAADLVGSSFTFQGELALNGAPVADPSDLRFSLWDAAVGGNQIGITQQLDAVDVQNGRFTVSLNDTAQFGAEAFAGEARFLEIEVRNPAGGMGAFTPLTPRQELTGTPYALGLSLPYMGQSDAGAATIQITSTGLFPAGEFVVDNAASNAMAISATTNGVGPAGYFVNLSGETSLVAKGMVGGTALYGDTPGTADDAKAIHGVVVEPIGGANSVAVYGQNFSLDSTAISLRGDSMRGTGVHGQASGLLGTGVYGEHTYNEGAAPGVHGVTRSDRTGAAGVRGEAPVPAGEAMTYGVHGLSGSQLGIGVMGEAATGVMGLGDLTGVSGEATNAAGAGVRGQGTIGVFGDGQWGVRGEGAANGAGVVGVAANADASSVGVRAVGASVANSSALRAENISGYGVHATGGIAVRAEGSEFGVQATTLDPTGYGGSFTNGSGGVALVANGQTELNGNASVNGTMSVHVLEILGGADLAERFAFTETAAPGMVVEIDPTRPGQLRVSREAYNPRVAGVISGANDLAAGVVLGEAPSDANEYPVALTGRVWVHCDTSAQGVAVGDLLTTSARPGYAMSVGDSDRATGAIIGKAMSSLERGESGMVLVLVNLH